MGRREVTGRREVGEEDTYIEYRQNTNTSVSWMVITITPLSVPSSMLAVYMNTLLSGRAEIRRRVSGVEG